jgi:DUF1009 family protein
VGNRIGIIAGSGLFPFLLARSLKAQGKEIYVISVEKKVESRLLSLSSQFLQIWPGEMARFLQFVKENEIDKVFLAGKVDPLWLLRNQSFDSLAWKLWPEKGPATASVVIEILINFLKEQGIEVLDPSPFLEPFFCQPGYLTRHQPSPEALRDLDLAFDLALKMADLEIGQVVAVKKGVIVSVEALEGTDKMIRRAGKLAGEGMVVAKVGRTRQSLVVDVPAVGLATVRSLLEAKASCLGIEAGKVAFFEQEKALALAEEAGLAIVARRREGER